MSHYTSPLRYPGGKSKVTDYIQNTIVHNGLLDGHYVEPYAGGASVALDLLFNEYVKKITINDIDRSIYAFWHSVLVNTEKFCNLILETPVTVEQWREQRDIQKRKSRQPLLSLGFSTFFLNRTNRSGIIKGGMIGGLDQIGDWKIDARFNKDDLIERIVKISKFAPRINLYNLDTLDLLETLSSKEYNQSKMLYYFDPPYYVKGKDLYTNFYKHNDHVVIAKRIKKLKAKWLISYDDTPEIRAIYSKFRTATYDLNYSASKPKKGTEIMIYSNNMRLENLNSSIIAADMLKV